jgi:plasmid stabilization system protein ParE
VLRGIHSPRLMLARYSTKLNEATRVDRRRFQHPDVSDRSRTSAQDVNSNRRQPGEITVPRRRKRVARVVPAKIESRSGGERLLGQERVRFSARFHTAAGKRQVGPGRHDHRADRTRPGAVSHFSRPQTRQEESRPFVKRRFLLTPEAKADLREILLDIAEDSPGTAERLRSELYDALQQLGQPPGIGHYHEELLNRRYRFWNFYSYVVCYVLGTEADSGHRRSSRGSRPRFVLRLQAELAVNGKHCPLTPFPTCYPVSHTRAFCHVPLWNFPPI